MLGLFNYVLEARVSTCTSIYKGLFTKRIVRYLLKTVLVNIYRPKSVPSSPMVKRAIHRIGTITAGWGRSIRKQQSHLSAEDKKKWASSQDCSSKM